MNIIKETILAQLSMMMQADPQLFAETLDQIMSIANDQLNKLMQESEFNVDKSMQENIIQTH